MSDKKVCILAPIHIWDDVRVFKKQAVSLSCSGYDVTLIARMDQELDGTIQDGVKLVRSKLSDKGKLGRIFFSYQVLRQALTCKADIYHLHNPNTIPIAISLRLASKRVIYDTHEDYSERLLFREWIPKIIRKPACWLVSFLEKFTANISLAAIGTQEGVVKRLGKKAHLIGNPPRYNEKLIKKVNNLKSNLDLSNESLRLVYLGSINKSRGVTDIVNALEEINKVEPTKLWLIGEMDTTYLNSLKILPGWQYVDYLGRLDQDIAFAYVSESDLGLIYIHDVGDHAKTDPNKLYEYMSFGKPFVASDFSTWRDKLQRTNAGVFVQPQQPNKLAKSILELVCKRDILPVMGVNGRKYVENNCWEKEFSKLEKIYREVL